MGDGELWRHWRNSGTLAEEKEETSRRPTSIVDEESIVCELEGEFSSGRVDQDVHGRDDEDGEGGLWENRTRCWAPFVWKSSLCVKGLPLVSSSSRLSFPLHSVLRRSLQPV